jgi:hypothetical protein
LVKALYGNSELQTEIGGAKIKITETTNYPFDMDITFNVEVSRPIEFTLGFRKPEWCSGFSLAGVDDFKVEGNLIQTRKTWQNGDQISLGFEADVKIQPWRDETIFRYGALLFCLPLNGDFSSGREYAPGFQDQYYTLTDPSAMQLRPSSQPDFTLKPHPFDPSKPFYSLSLEGTLIDINGNLRSVQLLPLGRSILRRVTFQTGEK